MNYTVRWLRSAKADMANAWIRAANKDAVGGYFEQIDRILGRDPLDQGESREGAVRLWFHRPLSVLYKVDTEACVVLVGRVRWVGH